MSSPLPGRSPRLNIVDLIKDQKQWSLYILALIQLQQDAIDNPLSWFAISSIHGWPYDLEYPGGGPKKERVGYCTHSDPRFPTWHRPYVDLHERALQSAALVVAKKYRTDTDAWGRAAMTLRSPYWDWADPRSYLPPPQVYDYENYKTLKITTPNGLEELPNPLLAYKFQREIDWKNMGLNPKVTQRRPGAEDPIKDFEAAVGAEAHKEHLSYSVWTTLVTLRTWEEFSNSRATRGQRTNSLETQHDHIHGRAGGNGHMGNPYAAGYDPLFMLHHTNVDRLLAFWQTLHPGVWIAGDDAKKPLKPFRNDKDQDIDSNDVKYIRSIYPEFVGLQGLPEDEVRKIIQRKVKELYNPRHIRPGLKVLPGSSQSEVLVEWFVRIRIKKFHLDQTFKTVIFLGPVPQDPAEWISSPNFVGSHTVFVNPNPELCGNCRENSEVIVEGFVSLTDALKQKGYEHKSEAEIEKYIHDEIHWVTQKVDGTLVPSKELKVFEVAVITFEVTDDDAHTPLVFRDIISHKDGGYNPHHSPYEL